MFINDQIIIHSIIQENLVNKGYIEQLLNFIGLVFILFKLLRHEMNKTLIEFLLFIKF